MARETLTLTLHIDGARETIRAFSRLPKEASTELRAETLKLSQRLAFDIAAAARSQGHQAALMAPTVKANRDRVPSISAGGSKRVGRRRVPAGRLIFASEFGQNKRTGWYAAPRYRASSGRQYEPHKGRHSYWFHKTAEQHGPEINRAWNQVADRILRSFERGDV